MRKLCEEPVKPSTKLLIPVLLGLLILLVAIPLIVFLLLAQRNVGRKRHEPGAATPWPVISREVSAFASSGSYSAVGFFWGNE